MSAKPCLTCGEVSEGSYCDEHAPKPWQHREGSARARGYDRAWDKLSQRARKLQPFCSLCFSTEDLTTDHLPSAWRRKAEGKAIRLKDVRVLCNDCNVDAGTSRPAENHGTGALDEHAGPGGKARSASLTGHLAQERSRFDAGFLASQPKQLLSDGVDVGKVVAKFVDVLAEIGEVRAEGSALPHDPAVVQHEAGSEVRPSFSHVSHDGTFS